MNDIISKLYLLLFAILINPFKIYYILYTQNPLLIINEGLIIQAPSLIFDLGQLELAFQIPLKVAEGSLGQSSPSLIRVFIIFIKLFILNCLYYTLLYWCHIFLIY